MRTLLLVATIGLLPLAAAAAPAGQGEPAQDKAAQNPGTQQLNDVANERLRRQTEAREQAEARNREVSQQIRLENERAQREYQEQVQALERANAEERARYEAEMARHRAEQAEYERRTARGGGRSARNERRAAGGAERDSGRQAEAATDTCQDQQQRARRRGRAVGGALGGVAGAVGGRNLGTAARIGVGLASVPVGALIGQAIASLLDCREQQQAAVATEQAVEAGVGRTVSWRSETRENVTGTSTVTALSTPSAADANACMTVTDVIIVDGEETRAEKRMCRRPPTNRFVRV